MTFGSVVTAIYQFDTVVFYEVGEKVGGCDLVLNCGQLQAEEVYKPDVESKIWYKPRLQLGIFQWKGEIDWKSINLTHTGECDECNTNH